MFLRILNRPKRRLRIKHVTFVFGWILYSNDGKNVIDRKNFNISISFKISIKVKKCHLTTALKISIIKTTLTF